jgi:hypothetical protein
VSILCRAQDRKPRRRIANVNWVVESEPSECFSAGGKTVQEDADVRSEFGCPKENVKATTGVSHALAVVTAESHTKLFNGA